MKASAREYAAYITELSKELEMTDKHICELEALLEAARATREGIKRQLNAYAITLTPICQLPYELLLDIFQKWDADQFKRNATLLFVCKAWNHLVMRAPEMWTDIRIECNRALNLPVHFSYAEACVHRSAGLLLDISIRIKWNSDGMHYERICQDLLENATMDVNHAVRITRAYRNLYTLQICPPESAVRKMMQFLLRILTGDDQMHMDRWRGFSLCTDTGSPKAEAELWNSLTGPTSNLLTLSFYTRVFSGYRDAILGFPKLSAVQSFISNQDFGFATLSLRPQIVTNICLRHYKACLYFMRYAASLFTALVKLDLTFVGAEYLEASSRQVYVPRLQDLRVTVTTSADFLSCFDAPNLSFLELSGSISQTLPSSDIFTRIETFVWSADPPWSTGPLRSVLVQTTLLVNLSVTVVQGIMEDNIRREILDIKATEGGLSHLKLVKYVWSHVPVDDDQSGEGVGLSLDTDPHDWEEARTIESSYPGRWDFWL